MNKILGRHVPLSTQQMSSKVIYELRSKEKTILGMTKLKKYRKYNVINIQMKYSFQANFSEIAEIIILIKLWMVKRVFEMN